MIEMNPGLFCNTGSLLNYACIFSGVRALQLSQRGFGEGEKSCRSSHRKAAAIFQKRCYDRVSWCWRETCVVKEFMRCT